jgi:CelD/BcsL family acetyltransferase involved in cellulose biosynthesis
MICELSLSDERCWVDFLARHPDALVFHHPAWIRALAAAYEYEMVLLGHRDRRGDINGVLPLALKRGWATGRRLVSLPHTPIAGPIASDRDVEAKLVVAAIEYARARGARLELKTRDETLGDAWPALARSASTTTYVLALPDDPANLRFGNSRNHGRIKWAVGKAAREGVTLRDADTKGDLRAWHRLYLSTMQAHAVPPRPYSFFAALWDTLRPARLLRLLVAERGERLLAGSIFLMFGATVFYAFNGRHRKGLGLRPNDLIQWQAIHDATAAGFRFYDFGEVEAHQEGLAEFKGKWGAEPSELFRYRFPQPKKSFSRRGNVPRVRRFAEASWRRLPIGATSWIGDFVYRRL